MIRLGATASPAHLDLCRALETIFPRHGLEYDWLLYPGYDQMVAAFVRGEINLAWNGPLSHVKMRRAFPDGGAPVLAMRDVDVGFTTRFIARADSDIATIEDLPGRRFAFAARDSVEAGLLPVHFLKTMGINPNRALAAAHFTDQRAPMHPSDQTDVILQVLAGRYDVGAVSARALSTLSKDNALAIAPANDALPIAIDPANLRVFWTSPEYSHCCFTAHPDLDARVAAQTTAALIAVDDTDAAGRAVLKAEACDRLVPGIAEGWDIVETAALAEGLIC